MKIDRLLAIITTLLNTEKTTLSFLAEKFEVSKRTIQRDIETLSKAGIPVYTIAGGNGGVFLIEDFVLDKEILKEQELSDILTGLQSLASVSSAESKYQKLFEKMQPKSSNLNFSKYMTINLASYYKDSLSEKIETIHQSIKSGNYISFDYFSAKGDSRKTIKPFHLTFQWESWYVWGQDSKSQKEKLYKLNRLWDIKVENLSFPIDEIPAFIFDIESFYTGGFLLEAEFDTSVKWRLAEEYGINSFRNNDADTVSFIRTFENADYCLQWLLSFGSNVKILAPQFIQDRIVTELENSINNYKLK